MEIAIKGEGEVVVRLIDRRGRALIQENVVVSGSPAVEARRIVPLAVTTPEGEVALAPVLVHQSNPQQEVSFDGQKPTAFTRRRCEEIGCSSSIAADAERGRVQPVAGHELMSFISDDHELPRLVQTVRRANEAGPRDSRRTPQGKD
jgi:hypothetical protein